MYLLHICGIGVMNCNLHNGNGTADIICVVVFEYIRIYAI